MDFEGREVIWFPKSYDYGSRIWGGKLAACGCKASVATGRFPRPRFFPRRRVSCAAFPVEALS
jgi:hypothetical protein